MAQLPAWMIDLNQLEGLTAEEKAEAEALILTKPESDRPLYVSGTPAQAVHRIKTALRSAGMDLPIHEAFDYCLLACLAVSPRTYTTQQPAALLYVQRCML
jgi:hypothetical protein